MTELSAIARERGIRHFLIACTDLFGVLRAKLVPAPGRFECRLADGAASPYLLQAALLAAGLDGMAWSRDPGPPLAMNMYDAGPAPARARPLPSNLLDAMRAFEASGLLRTTLGEAFTTSCARLQRQNWDTYMRQLTQWERDTTVDC